MMAYNKADENLLNNKKHGPYTLLCGLLLIVLAVGLYGYRTGAFGSKHYKSEGKQLFYEYAEEAFESINDKLVERAFSDDEGEAVTDASWSLPRTVVPGLNIMLPLSVNGELSWDIVNNEDRIIVTDNKTDNIILEKEKDKLNDAVSVFAHTDIGKKALKKGLLRYETMFLETLLEYSACDISKDINHINRLNDIIVVDTELGFEFAREETDYALDVTFDALKKDKGFKKAYEKTYEGDETYEEFTERLKKSLKNENFVKIYGKIYATETDGVTMADVTAVLYDENRECETSRIVAGSVGYGSSTAFLMTYYRDDEKVIDISGKGTYNKKSKMLSDARAMVYFVGTDKLPGFNAEVIINTIQLHEQTYGCKTDGDFSVLPESNNIECVTFNLESTNSCQNIRAEVTYSDKSIGEIQVKITDK